MSALNLLLIEIEEPNANPALNSDHHALSENPVEAEHRYRAIISTLLQQLTGLNRTHVIFIVTPKEALEAVTFWILSQLRGGVSKQDNVFHFTPEQNAPNFTLEFCTEIPPQNNYQKIATLSADCPHCSSRWLNTAFLQCTETHHVVGKNYLKISHQKSTKSTPSITLPDLPIIQKSSDWELALHSPIGGKLKKHYECISGNKLP